ncbi:MAG: replication factor C large subunit [Candidatus Pacearchaeota archaeon]|nr:MAG: replication factor C large subunit [Candidatus Pacearchaeota archaeon]
MIPWTEKYRPRKLKDIVGNVEARKKILDFVKNFPIQRRKAVLLYGPAGSGKTSIAYALASEFDYEIIELNASDFRNKQQIKEIIGQAIQQKSLFSKGKIILVDEIDGITGTRDRGGLSELMRLIIGTCYPIILVANDAWQAKLRPLRSKTQFIELKALDKESIVSLLQKTSKKEKLKISSDAFETISITARGDARAAITDLQILASVRKENEITKKDALDLCSREKDENIFQALRKIFKAKDKTLRAFNNVQNINTNDIFLWIDENLPLEYRGEELAKAYDALSKADVFRGRIRRWQHWRFLVYINALLTEGISNSKKEAKTDFTSYKPPSRILKIWIVKQKQAKRKEIAEKLAKIIHTSKKRAYKELPFLEIAFQDNIPFTNL